MKNESDIVFGKPSSKEIETDLRCKTCGKPPKLRNTGGGWLHRNKRYYLCDCRTKYSHINEECDTLKKFEQKYCCKHKYELWWQFKKIEKKNINNMYWTQHCILCGDGEKGDITDKERDKLKKVWRCSLFDDNYKEKNNNSLRKYTKYFERI